MTTPTVAQIKATYSGYQAWNDPNAIVADYLATGGSGKGNNPYILGSQVATPATPVPSTSPATVQSVMPGAGTPQAAGSSQSALEQVLIQKGGYNPTDAKNAAMGPRAAELAKEFGVSSGMGMGTSAFGNQPTIDVEALYNTNFNTPEINEANLKVSAVDAKILERQKARDEQVGIINDNPFYSEATRVGKINQLNEKYNADVTTLQNEKALAADVVAKKKADAEIKVNLALKQYDINNQAYKDQLNLFNSLLSSGGLTNATGTDIANYALATGIPTSMIEGILDKQKQEAIKTQLITSTDDNGNVTITAVDANTGSIINKTSLGNVGSGSGGGGGGLGGKNLQSLKKDVAGWMNLAQLAQKYVGVFSKDEVLQVYNTFHANDAWGAAKESSEELNKIFGVSKAGGLESLTAEDKSNVNQLKDGIKNKLFTREEAVQQFPEYAPYI